MAYYIYVEAKLWVQACSSIPLSLILVSRRHICIYTHISKLFAIMVCCQIA